MRRQRWSALLAVLAILASIPLLAPPAHACSCATPTIDQALHAGDAVAVVTRTDHTGSTDATFRVERALGADLPATLSGQVDDGGSCRPQILPEQVAAVALHKGKAWLLPGCSQEGLSDALSRTEGAQREESGRDAIAAVVGDFGGSQVVVLDHDGAVVAWDHRPGVGLQLANCPGGGGSVAEVGQDPEGTTPKLTVYYAQSLHAEYTVPLPLRAGEWVVAMRCDGGYDTVRLLVTGPTRVYPNATTTRLLTIARDKSVTEQPLLDEELRTAVPVPGGFLASVARDRHATFRHIGNDGSLSDVALSVRLSYADGLVATSDGRTVALVGYLPGRPKATTAPPAFIYVVDAASGTVLARRKLAEEQHLGMAWNRSGDLLVRMGYSYADSVPYFGGKLHRFDNRLVERDSWLGQPGNGLAAVGNTAVNFGGSRMQASAAGSAPRVIDNLWLTQASQVVGLTDEGFRPGTIEPSPATSDIVKAVNSLPMNSTDDPAPYVLIGLGAIIAGIFLGRRLSSRGTP
jgi:hypothetical protein